MNSMSSTAERRVPLKQNFKVEVGQTKGPNGTRFIVGIEPCPVVKWYDAVNAREEMKLVVKTSMGQIDRRNAILVGTMRLLQGWSDRGILFPVHWNDNDEYIRLLALTPVE